MAHHGETQGMDDSGSHDCCDTERGNEADPAPGCGHDMACGLCVIATSAVPALPEVFAGGAPAHRPVPAQSQLFTRHTSPPLRPPINVS
jgi:hypothetical protein